MFTGRKHTEETRRKMKKNNARYWLGKKRPKPSKKTREKMSESHLKNPTRYWLGKKKAPFSKEALLKMGKANKGRKHTEVTKAKMRESKLGKNNPMFGKFGEAHHNYIIDRNKTKTDRRHAYDTRYREWMNKVKNRDNRKCALNNEDCCGRLEAHHIKSWLESPQLRYRINNGISLCQFHHPHKRKDEIKLAPVFQKIVAAKA